MLLLVLVGCRGPAQVANEQSEVPVAGAPAFKSGVEEVSEPGSKPEADPVSTSGSTSLTEPEPEAKAEPEPSPYAPALARLTHAPVIVLGAVDTPDGVFVAYRFNTLAAHLGALEPNTRARARAKLKQFEASCTVRREQALASIPEAERHLHDQDPPCAVQAAWSIIDRPPPHCGKHSCIEAPDDLSPRCDALGVALLRAPDVVKERLILTQKSCLERVEPLQREHLTGQGRAEILVTATHEEWDSAHYWGWSVNTSTRRLLAFKLDRGRIEQVLELSLDEQVFLDGTLRSSGRYTIDRPGVITRYWEAWNSIHDGVQIDQVRWSRKRGRWSEPKMIEENNGSIPGHALPLDRWGVTEP